MYRTHIEQSFIKLLAEMTKINLSDPVPPLTPGKRLSVAQKAFIWGLYSSDTPAANIATIMKISPKAVYCCIKRCQELGDLNRKPGSGRKRKTSEKEDRRIVREIKKDPLLSGADVRRTLNLENISERTVRRRITESGEFYSRWQTPKPLISEKNRLLRLEWAKKHENWTLEQWGKVFWTDESPFTLRNHTKRRGWARRGKRLTSAHILPTVKHDRKIQVWGGFCAEGVGTIYRIPGILDKNGYKLILENKLKPSLVKFFPNGDGVFQQDNDPKHTAKINQQWVSENINEVMKWPPQSPDLNPIENLWALVDEECRDRKPKNEEELFKIIETTWYNMSEEILYNLVESMPRRVEAVFANNGWATEY